MHPIGIYSTTQSAEMAAFAGGVCALGLPMRWRSHSDYKAGETEPFSAVVISGLRAQGRTIRDDYRAIGVPVIVIDYGYLRRVRGVATWATGYWQVGVGGLNAVPPFPCPTNRWLSHGLELGERRQGRAVLVCGQHAGDPSHGLNASGIEAWAESMAALRALTQRPLVWRPHPDTPGLAPKGFDAVSTVPWERALEDVHAVVTMSSNIGHEALIAGVPVFCSPMAPYAALANADLAAIEAPRFPSAEERLEYFARLAYGQWTLDELRSGAGVRFVLAWASQGELIEWEPASEEEIEAPATAAAAPPLVASQPEIEPLPAPEPEPLPQPVRRKPGPKPGSKRTVRS